MRAVWEDDELRRRQPPEIHYWNESVSHVNFWCEAVSMQVERVKADVADGIESQRRIADSLFLIVAAHRLSTACGFAAAYFPDDSTERARVHDARSRFLSAYPDLKRLRHQTEHFDAWLKGEGLGQPPVAGDYPWKGTWTHVRNDDGTIEYRIVMDDVEVDVLAAADAAITMGRQVNDVFNDDIDGLTERLRATED